MPETLDINVEQAWNEAVDRWNHPSVPAVIAPKSKDEVEGLGDIGAALQAELAFMKYPEFQTYANIAQISQTFGADAERGLKAVLKHEVGHRFSPYDTVTSIILDHAIQKELGSKKLPYDKKSASHTILNLFTDMCINTNLTRNGDEDIPWAYQHISATKGDSKLWRVYARSMEIAWNKKLLPDGAKLSKDEQAASQELADLFKEDYFDKTRWPDNVRRYAGVISKFLEDKQKDQGASLDPKSGQAPDSIDEKTAGELAKRLAEIGSNGLPTNPKGLKEFKDIMAGYGQGDPKKASIMFYDKLSDAYDVMFATRLFGRPRVNPFQPIKWEPSMGTDKLDVDYSVQSAGKIIPGVSTYSWNTRKRDAFGGMEEVVPDLDLYIDSSGSTTNPIEEISLFVLASFVLAKKAHRKGAKIRSTNFSGNRQYKTEEYTRDLQKAFENFVIYYNGGTVFPADQLTSAQSPRQVVVITDTFLGNEQETVDALAELKSKHAGNSATIYALHPVANGDSFRRAGAQIIHGTTTDIFKEVIGKANQVYSK